MPAYPSKRLRKDYGIGELLLRILAHHGQYASFARLP
jgi:hypothetical protein